jgi:Cu/Ag efflux pump CusA
LVGNALKTVSSRCSHSTANGFTAFLLQTVLPAEAALDEVDRLNHRVEDALREVPEVEDVVRRTGRAERTEDPMPHTVSDVLVVLKTERSRDLEAIVADMRERLEGMPGIVRPKLMTAGTATPGLLPLLVLQLHGAEIERPLAIVMIGGLATSTLFTLLVLPTFYLQAHGWLERRSRLHDDSSR